MIRYSVILVAHDQPRLVLGALLALRKQSEPTDVVLVDNASTVEIGNIARLAQLPARTLRLPSHRSLGAAFNAGLDVAECNAVLLMHSDVVLQSDPAIGVRFLEEHPDVGVVGTKLFRPGEPPQRVVHAGYRLPQGRLGPIEVGWQQWDRFREPRDVDGVSDACMLLRRTDVRFDERYWFRLEDIDLCLQYQQQDYRVVFFPDVQAVHLMSGGAQARSTEPAWAERLLASQWLYHERWCSALPLGSHPRQQALRGGSAEEVHRSVPDLGRQRMGEIDGSRA
jgi:GT2 family glycosyltransferase